MFEAIQGIDVSHWQDGIDFDQVEREGYIFAIAKATDGTGDPDPGFGRHLQAIRDAGLVAGAYHFARPSSVGTPADAEAEAMEFARRITEAGGLGPVSLPPAIDFEEYSDNGPAENGPWLSAFVHVVELELGTSPMIYTGRNVWRYEAGHSDAFDHLPLWLVRYDRGTPSLELEGFGQADLWQWSGGGRFAYGPKVAGRVVDINRFVGPDWTDLTTPRIRPPWCEVTDPIIW